jgi:hypothetical protein
MKKLLLILFFAAVFSFQHYAESLADEKKTITPQEFGTAIAETPGKLVNFIGAEVNKTKEYQKKTWSKTMQTWPWNKIFKKGDNQ